MNVKGNSKAVNIIGYCSVQDTGMIFFLQNCVFVFFVFPQEYIG